MARRLAQLALLWAVGTVCAPAATPPAARHITDAAGRSVSLPARVGRVADSWHANNALVLLLGGADKLVATTVQAQRQPWLQRLYPRIDAVPAAFNAAGDANLETLIGARPDVVLSAYNGAVPKWVDALQSYGVPVVLMPNGSLAELKTTARITGEVLGEAEAAAAAEYIAYFDANIDRVRKLTGQLAPAQRPKVLHTSSASTLTVDGRRSVIDDWIFLAGGRNAAEIDGLNRPVSLEQIAAWNPDVIIIGTAPNGANRRAVLDDSRWQAITAVQRGAVYVNPSGAYLWDRHSAEAALQILWAAKLLHPELFKDLDVKRETMAFYARFFHHALTDHEFDSIMNAVAP